MTIGQLKILQSPTTYCLCPCKCSAQEVLEHIDRISTEPVQSIERRWSELRELIRAQQEAAVSRAAEMLRELEQEIEELRRGEAELEVLSREEDHVHFLQVAPMIIISTDIMTGTVNLPATSCLLSFSRVSRPSRPLL